MLFLSVTGVHRYWSWLDTYLSNEIWVSDYSSHKEAVIHHLCSLLYLSWAKVDMKAVVICRHCLQVEVAHSIEFQLKSKRRFQMSINAIFTKLHRNKTYCQGLWCTLQIIVTQTIKKEFRELTPSLARNVKYLGTCFFLWTRNVIRRRPFSRSSLCSTTQQLCWV